MRIAFLATDIDLSGHLGDVSHVKDLSLAFVRAGCEVDLFVANEADFMPSPFMRVHRVAGKTLDVELKLIETLRSRIPDVIYERRGSPKLSFALSRLLRRPFFVEINGLVDEERRMLGKEVLGPGLRRFVRLAIRAWMLRSSWGVVTVSDGLQRALINDFALPTELIHVIPNGVDVLLFQPHPQDEVRRKLGVPATASCVVFSGNLAPWQGLDTLLSSFVVVHREVPEALLYIVGEGVERHRLETQAQATGVASAVRFTGAVSREIVPLWISACDVAVSPKSERISPFASPLKVREYLACGRPVVATALGGSEPPLDTQGVGVEVWGDDPDDLARALVRLLRSPEERNAMQGRARKYAEKELSWDNVVGKLLALFRGTTMGVGEGIRAG